MIEVNLLSRNTATVTVNQNVSTTHSLGTREMAYLLGDKSTPYSQQGTANQAKNSPTDYRSRDILCMDASR